MAYLCHPLLGDTLYGKPSKLIDRQALHSYFLRFAHPISNEIIELKCDLTNSMKNIL